MYNTVTYLYDNSKKRFICFTHAVLQVTTANRCCSKADIELTSKVLEHSDSNKYC